MSLLVNTIGFKNMTTLMPRISWSINEEIKAMAKEAALAIEQAAKDSLGEDNDWPPITEATRQARTNPDNGPLLDMGYLRDSIKAVARRDSSSVDTLDIVYAIGPVEGSPAFRKNGEPYDVAAAAWVMEFGGYVAGTGTNFDGKYVPPRPFLRTTLKSQSANVKKMAVSAAIKGIRDAT